MSTSEERKLNDEKIDFIIKLAAGDNQDADLYLRLLAYCARVCDDIVDDFHLIDQNALLSLVENLFIKIPSNKFYKNHQDV